MEYSLFLGGFIFLLIEFAVPGSSVFGLAGLASMTAGAYFLLGGGQEAVLLLGIAYGIIGLVLAVCLFLFPEATGLKALILREEQQAQAHEETTSLEGQEAVAITALRPAGTIDLEGRRLDALSTGGFIEKGARVKIINVEGNKLLVQEI